MLSAKLCHADACTAPGQPSITSVSPISAWYSGQTVNVVITGAFPGQTPAYPGCTFNSDFVSTTENPLTAQSSPYFSIATNSSGDAGTFTTTQITLTITISPAAPTGTYYIQLTDDGGQTLEAPVQVSNCPSPGITSISPNVWVAGQSNPITITGTNFVTQAAASQACPETSDIVVSTPSTNPSVKVVASAVNVVSATEVTASVRPTVGSYSGGDYTFNGAIAATVAVDHTPRATDLGAPVSTTAQVDVLGPPEILWNGNPASGSVGPQDAVVGQQILLTTFPTAATLAALPIPLTFAATNPTTWMVTGGTNIGGYTPTAASASVTAMPPLNTPNLTFYSVFPADAVAVTYTYCVSGQTECPEATATFNVTGPPSVTVTPSGQEFFIGDNPPAMNWGIQFAAEPDPGYSGNFIWIQIVQSINEESLYSSGNPVACTGGPGFDAGSPPTYPFASGLTAEDGPSGPLDSPPQLNQNEQTESASFQMYLMWNSGIGSGPSASIPVPLGSISWNIAGDVVWNSTAGAWQKKTGTSNATTNGDFVPSATYPTWTQPVTPQTIAASCKEQQ